MILENPEGRRALRTIVGSIIALALVAFVWWEAPALIEQAGILELLRDVLIIVGMGVFFHGAENLGRAIDFKISKDGAEAKIGKGEGDEK